MDPLTHTLFGAAAASTTPARRTPLATAALLIGANLPDVDAFLYFVDTDRALAFRRGWTHGLPAMLVWPLLLTAALLAWSAASRRAPPDRRRLLLWSSAAVWSHPCLDWLNTYGMRWWMPFDGTWFYGDAVFIADPWLWMLLGCGLLLALAPRARTLIPTALVAALLAAWVAARAPRFLPIVLGVGGLALLAAAVPLSHRWRSRAVPAALLLALFYVGGRIALQNLTAARVRTELAEQSVEPLDELMVGPVPVALLTWDVVAATPAGYRFGRFTWNSNGLELAEEVLPVPPSDPASDPAWLIARQDPSVAGFVGWARFPWYEIEPTPGGVRVHLLDARYARSRTRGFGGAVVEIPRERLEERAPSR